jgi:hypothetical protein
MYTQISVLGLYSFHLKESLGIAVRFDNPSNAGKQVPTYSTVSWRRWLIVNILG